MHGIFKLFIGLLLLNFASVFASDKTTTVRFSPPESQQHRVHQYYVSLLKLALEKTRETDGDFELKPSHYYIVQPRAIKEVVTGNKLDVCWTVTSNAREQDMLPIRIPLLKGLLGYRLLMIRDGEQAEFAKINAVESLGRLVAGQGEDWIDTKVLQFNGLNVLGITDYFSIFPMLAKKRVDYFPRGLIEPWDEIEKHAQLNLAIEESLLLHYQSPIYFFVHRDNRKLANRLERGLRLAIEDGSFEQRFLEFTRHNEIFNRARVKERKIFQLKNPYLPPATPTNEKKLWITLEGLE